MTIVYKRDLEAIDWVELKHTLAADDFDNGRTPHQLEISFRNSYGVCFACDGERIIGTARVLSDGVCNAYVVDVWTHSAYRNQGIARTMMDLLLQDLSGQHVYLFSDDMVEFYRKIGFVERPTGLEKVVGTWLHNASLRT